MKTKMALLIVSLFAASVFAAEPTPLQQMEQISFAPNTATDSLLLYSNGELLFERYENGYTADNKHVAWSMSKSISSAIVGALVYSNQFDIQKSICEYMPAATEYNHCDLRATDFLSWSSGLIWNELYEDPNGDREQSSVGQLLYGDGIANTAHFVISHPSATPGKNSWNYSTGDSTFLMGLARAALPIVEEQTFPWKYLFDPLGIDVTFGQDQAGNFGGGSSMYLRPRDMAKIGELYLARGLWNGKRIFSEEWVDYTNQRPETFDASFEGYSLHSKRSWWTISPKIAQAKKIPDSLIANGHWGQYIVIIPSLKMVLVRTGNNQDATTNFDLIAVIEKAVRAIEQQQGAK
jgi:CubicO group peptidase (beta-lactamase class C family)